MQKELIDNLLALSNAYCDAKGLRETYVGRLAANDGSFFKRLREGKTITVKKYDRTIGWFHENWPDGAAWPANVQREALDGVAA